MKDREELTGVGRCAMTTGRSSGWGDPLVSKSSAGVCHQVRELGESPREEGSSSLSRWCSRCYSSFSSETPPVTVIFNGGVDVEDADVDLIGDRLCVLDR